MSDFINQIAPAAKGIQEKYRILPSIVIGQAILESNWGKSVLAVQGYNLFGIKGNYNGQSIEVRSLEYDREGEKNYIINRFKKYPSWYESMADLALLYVNGVSWDRAKYKKVIGETDYKKAAAEIQKAGYASDPKYAEILVSVIEKNGLAAFDGQPAPVPKSTYPGYLIKKGSSGNIVRQIQQKLGVAADGIFGPKTETAVKNFQKANGLAADGIVGSKTWAKLFP